MRAICWCKLTKRMVCFPLFENCFLGPLFDFPSWLCLFLFFYLILILFDWIALSVALLCECFTTMFALTLKSFLQCLNSYDFSCFFCYVFFLFVFSVILFSLLLYCSKRFASFLVPCLWAFAMYKQATLARGWAASKGIWMFQTAGFANKSKCFKWK